MSSNTLAKLVVKLEAQTAEFQKRLDKADKRTKKFGNRTKKTLGNVNKLFAGLALGALTKKVVDATARQEQAYKQLEQGIKSTNDAVGFSAKELAGYASELQAATTFGDENIIAAQSKLVSFTKITGDEFLRTTELALDMSARFGTDVSAASIQLGKALNDPVANLSALSRAGIQFSKDQKDLIKSMVDSGNQTGAQKVILKELEAQFGGSARAARDTFGGAIQALGNNFGDLLEAKGGLKEAQGEIEKLNTLLSDPKTKEGADKLIGVLISGFTKLASVMAQIPDFATFLGESIAAAIGGPADLVRISDAIKKKQAELSRERLELKEARLEQAESDVFEHRANIAALEDEIALLEKKREVLTPTAPTLKPVESTPANTAGVEQVDQVEPVIAKLDETAQRVKQIVAETTPQIDQIRAKIAETAALFSKELLNPEQFENANALYQSQLEQIVDADKLAFEEKYAALEETFLSEYELLEAQKNQRLELVNGEIASKVKSEEELAAARLKITDKYKKDKEKLDDAAAQAEMKTALTVATGVIQILSAFAGRSFKAQKALAIATGIINIVSGVTKALNNPYPANLGFAAQVAAQGAGLMSTIKSTQPSSSSANLSVGGGGSPNSFSTPEAANQVQSTSEAAEQQNQGGKVVEFNLTVDEFTEEPMRKLIEKISETGEDLGIEFALRA